MENIKGDLLVFITQARDLGVKLIRIDYSGSGDSGCIEDITYYDHMYKSGMRFSREEMDINLLNEEVFKEYCSEKLLQNIEDWYNNEGGYGHILFNVDDFSYTIENNQYEQVVHTFNHEGTLDLKL